MKFLDELEALCKSSYSQSFVSIEIHELLQLISIARSAKDLVEDIGLDTDQRPNQQLYEFLKKSLEEEQLTDYED